MKLLSDRAIRNAVGIRLGPLDSIVAQRVAQAQLEECQKTFTLRDKAIEVIDMVACDETFDDSVTREAKVLGLIYTYAHAALGRCNAPHEAWVADLERHYADLKSGIPGAPMIP